MSIGIKVLQGTPLSGKNLCISCANMSRRVGQNLEDEIHCSSYKFETMNGDSIVKFKIASCTEYRPFNQQGIKDMEKIAWVIQPRTKGPAGFQPGDPIELELVPPSKRNNNDDYND